MRSLYFSCFLVTVPAKLMSEVNPNSALISLTAMFSPLLDVQVFVGPLGGCSVSGQPSTMTVSGCIPPLSWNYVSVRVLKLLLSQTLCLSQSLIASSSELWHLLPNHQLSQI
jgi:hypothetical protein